MPEECIVRANHFDFDVTTTMKEVLKENPKRRAVIIYNNGTDTVYIHNQQSGSKDQGMPLVAGAPYENDSRQDAIYMIAESGTQDVRIEEDSES